MARLGAAPRRRRKSNEQKAIEELAKWAAEKGGTLDLSSLGLTLEAGVNRETKSFRSRELDAMARYLRQTKTMLTKQCYNCKLDFKTDWENVGCCSVDCYVAWFEKTTGIKPNLAERQMWKFERPLVISADSLKQIREWAKAVLEDIPPQPGEEKEVPEEPPAESSEASSAFSGLPQFPGIPSLE